ncbi:GA-like domain-containing protein, partial [Escherichia coli]|uniref:cell envelope integrity protein TolA n=1 Tax=Escherichia coli TaxID=562 RepID=UPI0001E8A745
PDTVDAQEKAALDHAKALVAEAEAKQGEAKDALTKAQADNAINPQEHNDLTAKNQAVTDAKSPAADAVNALPEGEAKTELQGRLDKVTGIQVPDVTYSIQTIDAYDNFTPVYLKPTEDFVKNMTKSYIFSNENVRNADDLFVKGDDRFDQNNIRSLYDSSQKLLDVLRNEGYVQNQSHQENKASGSQGIHYVNATNTDDNTPDFYVSLNYALSGSDKIKVYRDGAELQLTPEYQVGNKYKFTDATLPAGTSHDYEYKFVVVNAEGKEVSASQDFGYSYSPSVTPDVSNEAWEYAPIVVESKFKREGNPVELHGYVGGGVHTMAMELPIYKGAPEARYFMTGDVDSSGNVSLQVLQWQQGNPAGQTKLHFFETDGSELSYNFNGIKSLSTDMTTTTGVNLKTLNDGVNIQKSVDVDKGYAFTDSNDYLIVHGQGTGNGKTSFGRLDKAINISSGDGDDVIVSQIDIDKVALDMGSGDDALFIASSASIKNPGASIKLGMGDDSFIFSGKSISGKALIDGGDGADSFVITGNNKTMDLSTLNIKGFEHIDIKGENSSVSLSVKTLLDNNGVYKGINSSEHQLIIDGVGSDSVSVKQEGQHLSKMGEKEYNGHTYDVYTTSSSSQHDELWISKEINVHLM